MHSSSDSNSIEFKCEDSTTIDSEVSENPSVTNEPEKINSPFYTKEIQFLYIQMEFCEKSTLRTAIDADLYLDNDRIWRLFREIIEGIFIKDEFCKYIIVITFRFNTYSSTRDDPSRSQTGEYFSRLKRSR